MLQDKKMNALEVWRELVAGNLEDITSFSCQEENVNKAPT